MSIKHYEVQMYSLVDGWANSWHVDDRPCVFATEVAARIALSDFFDDLREAGMAEEYSLSDYRIQAIHFDELLTVDAGDTPAMMARKIQAAISTPELRDLIDELAALYEPTDDMDGLTAWPVSLK